MIGFGLVWAIGSLLAGVGDLKILRLELSVRVSFQTEEDKQYQIFTSTEVDSSVWLPSGDQIEGDGEVYSFSQDLQDPAKRFFKLEEIIPFEEFTIADLDMIMVPISAGTFVMGSLNDGDQIGNSYGPPTTVTISRDFWMSQFEVTQGQYGELMGNNPSRFKSAGLNAPVEQVSWKEAVEYCQKLRDTSSGREASEPMGII